MRAVEARYDRALLVATAGWLVHAGVVTVHGGPFVEGVWLWPPLIGLCLGGHVLAGQPGTVFGVVAMALLATAVVARGAAVALPAVAAAWLLMSLVTASAERQGLEGVTEEAERSNRLTRDHQRLEASKRKYLEQSTRRPVPGASRAAGSGTEELRAAYRIQRDLLLGLVEARHLGAVAALWRRILEGLGVAQGLVIVVDAGLPRVAAAWGVADARRALAALFVPDGHGFLDWLVEKRAILEEREVTSHPMLAEARTRFCGRFFVPSLLVPCFHGDELVLAVVAGPQRPDVRPRLRPTLLSPLVPVQEELAALLRGPDVARAPAVRP